MKRILDQISVDLWKARNTNPPTYWLTLVLLATLFNGLIVLILTKIGLTCLVVAFSVFIADCLIRARNEIREAAAATKDAQAKAAVKRTKTPKV